LHVPETDYGFIKKVNDLLEEKDKEDKKK